MVRATVGKWGNNLAVRLPGDVVRAVRLQDGERVDIEAQDGAVVIRRAAPSFVLEELFQGRTEAEWRAAYADSYDWGPDIGREIIPE